MNTKTGFSRLFSTRVSQRTESRDTGKTPSAPLLTALLLFLLAAILPACNKIETGEPVECRIGESYEIHMNLGFSIDSINDYRCPEDLICLWGGDADLRFSIRYGRSLRDTVLSLYRNNRMELYGYSWQVLGLTPLPLSGKETEPGLYRVNLLIEAL